MDAQHATEQLVTSLLAWSFLYVAFVVAMFVITVFSAVHCTLNQGHDTKLCWVVIIIFLPLAGFLTYWIFRGSSEGAMIRSSNIISAPPPPNIAANVSAALSAQVHQARRTREDR
jgi:hypothetical protein